MIVVRSTGKSFIVSSLPLGFKNFWRSQAILRHFSHSMYLMKSAVPHEGLYLLIKYVSWKRDSDSSYFVDNCSTSGSNSFKHILFHVCVPLIEKTKLCDCENELCLE